MNARVQIMVAAAALIAIAGVFAFRSRPAPLSETKPQAVSAATTPVAQVAQEQVSEATKQAIAVQNAAASAVPDVKPVNEGYSFLTNSEELILNYRVNFDPTKDARKAQDTAQKLAKSWRIKELEAYQPKTVKIVLVHVTDRKKKEFGFTPSGEAL